MKIYKNLLDNLDGEIWRKIKKFPDYQISNYGRIKRIKTSSGTYKGKILKSKKDKDGYNIIGLFKDKKRYFLRICRLVLETFIGIDNDRIYCNHIDGIRHNDILSNLEWVTQSDNIKHSFKIGLKTNSNIPIEIIDKVFKILNSKIYIDGNITQKEIGKLFNISQETVSRIKTKKYWLYKK